MQITNSHHFFREELIKKCYHGGNFVKARPIFIIFLLLERLLNFRTTPYNTSHQTLGMLLHYPVKLKN